MEEVEQGIEKLPLCDELEWLKSEVLGKNIAITLPDERIVSGKLLCIDHQANIVVSEAVEYIPKFDVNRTIGLAIAPGVHIKKIELKA